MYNMITPPFESRSGLYGGLKPRIKNIPIEKLSSFLVLWTNKTSILPLTGLKRSSNLFLVEILFQWNKRICLSFYSVKFKMPSVTFWSTFVLAELHPSKIKATIFLSCCQFKILDNWRIKVLLSILWQLTII